MSDNLDTTGGGRVSVDVDALLRSERVKEQARTVAQLQMMVETHDKLAARLAEAEALLTEIRPSVIQGYWPMIDAFLSGAKP